LTAFEIRALSKISGPTTKGIAAGRRKFHNEELKNLYSSPNIITVIKSTRSSGKN
jgi:hypothetical protein